MIEKQRLEDKIAEKQKCKSQEQKELYLKTKEMFS